jgi:hypothetical protein
VLAVVLAACGAPAPEATTPTVLAPDEAPPAASVPEPAAAPTTSVPTPSTNAPSSTLTVVDPRVVLEPLVVDDRPAPDRPYRREEWRHWEDIDGNGCDARDDVLIATSTVPATLAARCRVVAGSWTSPYDGVRTTDPGQIQIDHLVPLADAHVSGGWRWDAGRRRLFANDPEELVAASAASNQSKGSSTPDEWRPPERGMWCTYALGWVRVKVTYDLTVTTRERDALGQMLETCPPEM